MQCSKCQATIAAGAKFCPKCGARAETPAVEAGGKRCPQCGTDNPTNAKFCKKDGYRFDAVVVKPEASVPASTAVSPPNEPKAQEAASKPIPLASDSVTCPKCGTANISTAKFCKKDGYPLQAVGAVTPPTAVATPPTAVQPPVAVPTAVPAAKPAAMASPVTPPAPKPAPQPVPAIQPAPVAPRPAISAAPRAPVKPVAAKSRRGVMIGAAVGAAILASAGGGYAYWAGYVGNRQGTVQNEINAELGSHGLSNIKVTVSHEWVASLTGTVPNQSEKDQAFGLVSGHKAVESIVNNVQVESNAAEVEKSLRKALSEAGFGALTADVDKELIATVSGTLANAKERTDMTTITKLVVGIKDVVDQTEVTGMDENPDAPPTPEEFNARISEYIGAGVSRPPLSSEELLALRQSAGVGNPSTENADAHNSLIAAMRNARVPLSQQQIQQIFKASIAAATAPPVSPPLPVASQSAPQRAADKAALERELNARLRANGVSGVTGRVNPDMSVALSGTVKSEDERYRALAIGGALPGANGVRETIQISTPQVARLAPPQAPIPPSPTQVAPPSPPQAAAIDPAKLEGDINRALRSRDINSITAQVNDDMSLTLKGSASAAEKERALQLTRQVRGIRGVKDKVFVVED